MSLSIKGQLKNPQGQVRIFDPSEIINAATYFSADSVTGNGSTLKVQNSIDLATNGGMVISVNRDGGNTEVSDTITGGGQSIDMYLDATPTAGNVISSFDTDGYTLGNATNMNNSGTNYMHYTFRQAPGFFDMQTYTGTGVAGTTVAHNLGVTPSMVWIKELNTGDQWIMQWKYLNPGNVAGYISPSTDYVNSAAFWNGVPADASNVTLGTFSRLNQSGQQYVMYLFGENEYIQGGSYTGNGNVDGPQINIGWQPQFAMQFYNSQLYAPNIEFHDSVRGPATRSSIGYAVGEQTDNRMAFNSTGIKITATGGGINANGDSYAYLAIRDIIN